MKIIAISGSGIGAGKTTLAKKLSKDVWSLAGAMRTELELQYPGYSWFNRDQAYKANTMIKEYKNGSYSMRAALIEYGQDKCAINPTYWVERLSSSVTGLTRVASGITTIAVDDVRKVCEVEHLRKTFKEVVHIHIDYAGASFEKEFDNLQLLELADYIVVRK